MPSDDYVTDAAAALRSAQRARAAANAGRPTPPWWGPVGAVTWGLGMALLLGPWGVWGTGSSPWTLAAGLIAVAVFPVMCVVQVRGMKVIAWPPPGTMRERTTTEFAPMAAYWLGWLAYFPFGWGAGAITSAVIGGIGLWWRTERKNALIARAAAERTA